MPTPTVDELCTMLTSPDPDVRDNVAYSTLARSIGRGELDGELAALGERIVGHLAHPEIQARTFAPLILDSCVSRDNDTQELDATTVLRWRDAFGSWWVGETDLRGYDEKLGWLHAVAHGSDFLGALGTSRHLNVAALAGLLDLGRARLMAPTDYLFAAAEDDRMAVAFGLILVRPELDVAAATEWIAPIAAALEAGAPVPMPFWVSNTVRTLNSLFVVISRGIRPYGQESTLTAPHRTEILESIAATLRIPARYLA